MRVDCDNTFVIKCVLDAFSPEGSSGHWLPFQFTVDLYANNTDRTGSPAFETIKGTLLRELCVTVSL